MTTLYFMGEGEPETFRARIYGGDTEADKKRLAFLRALATGGVLDCPAYDSWIAALQKRGNRRPGRGLER